jgi:hypothetical protein
MAGCMVCGSRDVLQRFVLRVDGVPQLLQPDLCQRHGDVFLLLAARAIGELFLTKNGQSGRPISEPAPAPPSIPAAAAAAPSPAQPDITISGRQDQGACWASRSLNGATYYCARGLGHMEHYNGNVGTWNEEQKASRQEDDPDFGRGRREFEAMQAARCGPAVEGPFPVTDWPPRPSWTCGDTFTDALGGVHVCNRARDFRGAHNDGSPYSWGSHRGG